MIKLDREYASTGIISAGSGLYVYDSTLSKYVLLVPVGNLGGGSAPETIENAILSVSVNGQVEGKQTAEQKDLSINLNRDNIRRLALYAGKELDLLVRYGMEYIGRRYKGTIAYDADDIDDNSIMNAHLWVTITEDLGFIDDTRDITALTAIVTSALPAISVKMGDTATVALTLSAGATATVLSESTSIATVSIANNIITVTPVAAGNTIIEVTASKTGEASSKRTFMLTVTPSA